MKNGIEGWILGVTGISIVLSLIQVLMPKNPAGTVGRIGGGLILVLVVVSPMVGSNMDVLLGDVGEDLFANEQSKEGLEQIYYESLEKIIEQEMEAYIVDRASELGVECAAEVSCVWSVDDAPQFQWVRIKCDDAEWVSRLLSELIKEELGIPEERQMYEEVRG